MRLYGQTSWDRDWAGMGNRRHWEAMGDHGAPCEATNLTANIRGLALGSHVQWQAIGGHGKPLFCGRTSWDRD